MPTILGREKTTYPRLLGGGGGEVCCQKSTENFATLIAHINLPSSLLLSFFPFSIFFIDLYLPHSVLIFMSCPLFITNWLLHQRGSWPIVILCMGPNFLHCNQSNNDMKKSHIGLPKVTLDCPKWHWIVQSHIGLAIFEIKLTLIRNKVTFDWPKWQKISNLWNQSNNDIKSHRIA